MWVATSLHLVLSLLFILLQFESSQASNLGLNDELRVIHHEIGLLKHENQQQNIEISLLKKMVIESNEEGSKSAHQNSIIQGSHDHLSLNEERPNLISKRPARLLPFQLLFYNRNCTTCNEQPHRFYGPPTNCSDLTRLGYTLNGFYMVNASSNNNSTHNSADSNDMKVETIYCAFKQEGTFDASLVEKRISPLQYEAGSSPPSVQLKLVSNKNVINFRSQPQTRFLMVPNIKFLRVTANVGGGYDEKTGFFVAPKSGVYKFIFKCTLMVFQSVRFRPGTVIVIIYLRHNGLNVGEVRYVQDDFDKNLLIEETLKLNRGDKIELLPAGEMGSQKQGNVHIISNVTLNEGKSSFSGFLIHEFDD